jgi:hypothetical protein
MERLLKWRQARWVGQAFDCRDSMAVGLHCQHRAGFDRGSVQPHGACTALRSVAADVRSGQTGSLAQKVNEQQARFDVGGNFGAVDLDRD